MQNADDLVMHLDDFNIHVGRYVDGFDGEYGLGRKEQCYYNFPGERIMCQVHGLGEVKRGW